MDGPRLEGIGMVIQPDDTQQLVVRSLSENGDAAASGLVQIGDIVYSINGQIVWRSHSSVVRNLILGPPGTEVTVGLLRPPDNVLSEATLRRGYTYGPTPLVSSDPRDTRISTSTRIAPRQDYRDPVLDSTRSSMQGYNRGDNLNKPLYGSPDRKTQSTSSELRGSSNTAASAQCGIGILLIPDKNGQLTVVGMNPGGPAKRTGQIKIGDILHSVDSDIVVGMPVASVRPLIVGPAGSEVTVTLQRPGQQQLVKVRLTRVRMRSADEAPPPTGNLRSSSSRDLDPGRRSIDGAPPSSAGSRLNTRINPRNSLDSSRRTEYSDVPPQDSVISRPPPPSERRSLGGSFGGSGSYNSGGPNGGNLGRHSIDSYSSIGGTTNGRSSFRNSHQDMRSSLGSLSVQRRDDEIGGIGAYLVPEPGGCFVVKSVIPGGPASREGQLRVGDLVRQIDGRSITGASMENVRQLVKGPPGSMITLGISHQTPGSDLKKIIEVVITRESMSERAAAAVAIAARQSQDSVLRSRGSMPSSLQASLEGLPDERRHPPHHGPEYTDTHIARQSLGADRNSVIRQSSSRGLEPKAGVGIILFQDSTGNLVVKNLVEMGPAERSLRIHKGDILCEVDGVSVFGFSVNDVRPMMVGDAGTLVHLKLQRRDTRGYTQLTLLREHSSNIDPSSSLTMRPGPSSSHPYSSRDSYSHLHPDSKYSSEGPYADKYLSAPPRSKQTVEQLL